MIRTIDAKTGSKNNDHGGGTPWTKSPHLSTPQNPELVVPRHDLTSDAFYFKKGI
jgi:hypothetical protein